VLTLMTWNLAKYAQRGDQVVMCHVTKGGIGKSLSSIEFNMPYDFIDLCVGKGTLCRSDILNFGAKRSIINPRINNIELYGDKGTIINR
jgi:hypothetical protein